MKTVTVMVGSHLGKVKFYGLEVSIGFLASFRKKRHLPCASGRGFVVCCSPGGERSNQVCECAVPRAIKHIKKVGAAAFEAQAAEWEQKERQKIADSENVARAEGREAGKLRQGRHENLFPTQTDQHLAWLEGYAEGEHDGMVEAELKYEEEYEESRDLYAEGADAAFSGVSDLKNPYPVDSDEHASWNDGYLSVKEVD